MRPAPGETLRPTPTAFFLTWTTYGTWLPGDSRGWVDRRGAIHAPDKSLRNQVRLASPPIALTHHQRDAVVRCIAEHCGHRRWILHAVQCRTAHVHVVVTSTDTNPKAMAREFKAWCSRGLNRTVQHSEERRSRWWSQGGSARFVFGERSLEAVITYVRDCQDKPR